MSASLLLVVALVYGYIGIDYMRTGRPGMALAFLAYALANIGFMLDLRK